jgi:hypothetical protein
VTVAGHRAVKLDPIHQQVDVFMVRIRVPCNDVLVPVQSHAMQVAPPYLDPLHVCQVFAWYRRQRHVQYCLAQARAKLANLSESLSAIKQKNGRLKATMFFCVPGGEQNPK